MKKKTIKFDSLSHYVGWLYAQYLDAEIRGIEFKYQKELDALNEWAHSIPDDQYPEDET